MRRASHKRPVSARAIAATPSAAALNAVAFAEEPANDDLLPMRDAGAQVCPEELDDRDARHRALEIAIQQRIQSRLLGRVRKLIVRAFDGVVILEGECATYYTKQLAQHTAMGILNDEHLENAIVVSVQ
jgi:osmotically-inducible protein OsmY